MGKRNQYLMFVKMTSHNALFCTILAKEKPVLRDNRYVLLNMQATMKVKLFCKTLLMHSTIEH